VTPGQPNEVWALTRDAVRSRVSEVALEMFEERGFDQVTVEEIAKAAGMSKRSFHRYFAVKEDVVIGDPGPWGEVVRDELAGRPAGEPVWTSLRLGYEGLLAHPGGGEVRGKRTVRILAGTPPLRARNLEKHGVWTELLVPVIAKRLDGPYVDLRARTLAQASLVCFDNALAAWAREDDGPAASEYLHATFDVVSSE
jgi:AcrR family transcriptional regulator